MNAITPLLRQMLTELSDVGHQEVILGELRQSPNAYFVRWVLQTLLDSDMLDKAGAELKQAMNPENEANAFDIDQEYADMLCKMTIIRRRLTTMKKSTAKRLADLTDEQERRREEAA